jgi:hypothetical protein
MPEPGELHATPQVVKTITCGLPQFIKTVQVHDTTLAHIRDKHPQEFALIDQVYATIENSATSVHQSKTNERSLVFVNTGVTSEHGSPLRVPIKRISNDIGILQTAHFSDAKDQGPLLWSQGGEEGKSNG